VTPRQMQVVRFIDRFRRERGYGPSLGEIGRAIGGARPTIHELIRRCVEHGFLVRGGPNEFRSWDIAPGITLPPEGKDAVPPRLG